MQHLEEVGGSIFVEGVNEKKYKTGRWSLEENQRLFQALEMFGNRWRLIERAVDTRSRAQIRSHCQKHYQKKVKEQLRKLQGTEQIKRKVFLIIKVYHQYATKDEIYKHRLITRKSKSIPNQDHIDSVEGKVRLGGNEELELMLEERDYSFLEAKDDAEIDASSLHSPKISNLTISNYTDTVPSRSLNQFSSDIEIEEVSPVSSNRLKSSLDIKVDINPLYP
jgi:hypothetical protein